MVRKIYILFIVLIFTSCSVKSEDKSEVNEDKSEVSEDKSEVNEDKNESSEEHIYISDSSDFKIIFPEEWFGYYEVKEEEGVVYVIFTGKSKTAQYMQLTQDIPLFLICAESEKLKFYDNVRYKGEINDVNFFTATFRDSSTTMLYSVAENVDNGREGLPFDVDDEEENLVKNDWNMILNMKPDKIILDYKTTEDKEESIDIHDEYLLYDSNTRLLTPEDIKNLSSKELRLAINEIYARHGRIFNTEEYKIYFNNKSWYTEKIDSDKFDERIFNEYEKNNINFLLDNERRLQVEELSSQEFKNKYKVAKPVYNIYEGNYRNEYQYAYRGREDYVLGTYYSIEIFNITPYTFDFVVIANKDVVGIEVPIEVIESEVISQKTAIFVGQGDMAVFYDGHTELKFTFPNGRESLPDIVQIKVDGLDFLEHAIYAFNGVPGHEFN